MTDSTTPQPSVALAPPVYPHHRDCIKCGYDLFGQSSSSVCPECGAAVLETSGLPLWRVSEPRRLARSRAGLLFIAISFLSLVTVAAFGLVLAMFDVEAIGEPLAIVVSLVALAVCMTGLVCMGRGVGSSAFKRWRPLVLAVATVAWWIFGEDAIPQWAMWCGLSAGLTLCWLLGVSLQSLILDVSIGVPVRAARLRAARMMKVSRLMLFTAAASAWTVAVLWACLGELALWYFGLLLIAIQAMVGLVAMWMLAASIHWLRLRRLWDK